MPEPPNRTKFGDLPSKSKMLAVTPPLLGMDKIELTNHAQQRMASRGVTIDDIETALRKPTVKGLKTDTGKHRIRWQKNPRTTIDVVYVMRKDSVAIISAWKNTVTLFHNRQRRT